MRPSVHHFISSIIFLPFSIMQPEAWSPQLKTSYFSTQLGTKIFLFLASNLPLHKLVYICLSTAFQLSSQSKKKQKKNSERPILNNLMSFSSFQHEVKTSLVGFINWFTACQFLLTYIVHIFGSLSAKFVLLTLVAGYRWLHNANKEKRCDSVSLNTSTILTSFSWWRHYRR